MREYTVQQVAEMLSTNEETVRRWIRSGRIRAKSAASRKQGLKLSEDALEDFISDNPKYARLYQASRPNRELQEGFELLSSSLGALPQKDGGWSESLKTLLDSVLHADDETEVPNEQLAIFLQAELEETRRRKKKLEAMAAQLQYEIEECERKERECEAQIDSLKNN